ncbi:MAG: glycosyltransferase family 61 protein [Chitinophagaceae bacterium]|nr:glycosyltransferase family 61 protein [Chitinophagaceae bacterium]
MGISRTLFLQKPAILNWFFKKKIINEVDRIISLRDTGEENYFHFFNDVLAKIYFLEQHGFAVHDYHLLIAEKTYNKSFFQFWLKHIGSKRNFKWLVQKSDEYIISHESVFCKPITHHTQVLHNLFQPYFKITFEHKDYPEKIYLKRNPKRLRFVENGNEIETLVKQNGYAVVDTDELVVADQIALFKSVKKVIGIHGAGLTNLFFCMKCEALIELFPPADAGYLPFHYIMVASHKNIRYNALIGNSTKNKFSGSFLVDRKELETLIINHQ